MPIYKLKGEKRDGFQKYRVVVNYTKDGKKKTAERLVYGKEAADRAEVEMKALVSAGKMEEKKDAKRKERDRTLTVAQLIERYEDDKKHEVRESTLAKKKSILKNHITPHLGSVGINDLNVELLTKWKQVMNEKPIGVTMKRNAYRELRALLNYAVKNELLPSSPLKKIEDFADPYLTTVVRPEKIRYYTKDEFKKYAAAAKEWAQAKNSLARWGLYCFFMIAYYTGARKGEINALRWSDWDGAAISISKSVTCKIKGKPFVETAPKNAASIRRIAVPEPLKLILNEQKERHKRDEDFTEDYRICGGPSYVHDTTIDEANRKIAELAGIKRITIHEFRHSHASLLCNAGINIKEIARRLGHADVEITLRTYAHLYPTEEDRALSVLNEIK